MAWSSGTRKRYSPTNAQLKSHIRQKYVLIVFASKDICLAAIICQEETKIMTISITGI